MATLTTDFHCSGSAIYWKKMPSRTFIAREEKSIPDLKASKNSLTHLLGADAVGDFKLMRKLIDHFENPQPLKNYAKSTLCSTNRTTKPTYMTALLFFSHQSLLNSFKHIFKT